MSPRGPRVLLVAEHASARFGGEAVLPLHYFRLLRERGVEAWLLVHERTRSELEELLPEERQRMHYLPDTSVHLALSRLAASTRTAIVSNLAGVGIRLATQWDARARARDLIAREGIDVVHQPIPVSPKDPSLLFGLGVPVVIGPMNGGMSYPPAFRHLASGVDRVGTRLARVASHGVHQLLRGKLEATTLLVANPRTRAALPRGVRGRVEELVENGVDFRVFRGERAETKSARRADDPLSAIFVGRLVDWKALDIVIEAMARGRDDRITLDVIGDGPMRSEWEALAIDRGLASRVRIHGFVPQPEVPRWLARADVLVLPSLYECGGAVVLEAMAMGLPVVATAWGGPLDYLDSTTGILVEPGGRDALIEGFARALGQLRAHPEIGSELGSNARVVVRQRFDWSAKIDRMLAVYDDAIARFRARSPGRAAQVGWDRPEVTGSSAAGLGMTSIWPSRTRQG